VRFGGEYEGCSRKVGGVAVRKFGAVLRSDDDPMCSFGGDVF
jgi:hypothetical protein